MTSSLEQFFYPLRTLLRIQTTESQRGKFWSIWWMRKKSLVQFSNCSHCMSSDMMTCIILLETDRMLCFYTHFKVLFWVILTVIVSSSVRKSMCMIPQCVWLISQKNEAIIFPTEKAVFPYFGFEDEGCCCCIDALLVSGIIKWYTLVSSVATTDY